MDSSQVIINNITPYHDSSFHRGALSFGLLISKLLEHIGFKIATSQRVQVVYALLEKSSWAKHYSHVYSPMASSVPDGPQDATPTQQAT